MVRAKFRVTKKSINDHGGDEVLMHPVTSGSQENEAFYKWTPGGEISLITINHDAAEQFVVGGEYYVDFTKVEG
jgi:hypothetical protein